MSKITHSFYSIIILCGLLITAIPSYGAQAKKRCIRDKDNSRPYVGANNLPPLWLVSEFVQRTGYAKLPRALGQQREVRAFTGTPDGGLNQHNAAQVPQWKPRAARVTQPPKKTRVGSPVLPWTQQHVCTECPKTYTSLQNLKLHKGQCHEGLPTPMLIPQLEAEKDSSQAFFKSGFAYMCYRCSMVTSQSGALPYHEYCFHNQDISEYYYHITSDGSKFMTRRSPLQIRNAENSCAEQRKALSSKYNLERLK